jgi:large subunit ribosomal protein L4
MNLPVFDKEGKSAGEVKASKKVFEVPLNKALVQSVLHWYLASKRAGTHSTKTKAEVSGGGKKPWKQKGTGRARVGSIRSPLWRHGGVTFGPKPRDYSYALPKKMRKKALAVLLSDRAREGKVKVIEKIEVESPKTALMSKFIKGLKLAENKVLIIADEPDTKLVLACRNLAKAKLVADKEMNVHDILKAEFLVLTKKSVKNLEGALK